MELETEIMQLNSTIEILEIKEKELLKTKEKLNAAEQTLDKQANDLRVSTVSNRK